MGFQFGMSVVELRISTLGPPPSDVTICGLSYFIPLSLKLNLLSESPEDMIAR